MSFMLLFVHAKIGHVYECTQSVYVIVVFMNAHNLQLILNIFRFSLFINFYKILNNSFGYKL